MTSSLVKIENLRIAPGGDPTKGEEIGAIRQTGGMELAAELDQHGFERWIAVAP